MYVHPQKCQDIQRNINILQKIDNIDQDFWGDDQEIFNIDNDAAENKCYLFDSNTNEENTRRGQKGSDL